MADQTWSASAYLRMIYDGLFGLNFQADGLSFAPHLPAGWGNVTLNNVKYRGALLDVSLQGRGSRITKVTIDGKPSKAAFAPASAMGRHTISITLSD